MFSIIFAGTSDFSVECLKGLLELDGALVAGVLSAPDSPRGRGLKPRPSPAKAFAAARGLPVYTPKSLTDRGFLQAISSKKCALSVVCAYGKLLPPAFLDSFPMESLNIHPSLLPRWRGAAPVERALMAGDRETGVSLQKVAAKMDTGDIVGREAFPIEKDDSAADIYKKALRASKKLLRENLLKYLKGEIQAAPQPESPAAPCARKIDKREARIGWNQSAPALHNKIRALALGPQAFAFLGGRRVKISRARIFESEKGGPPPGRPPKGRAGLRETGGRPPGTVLLAEGGRLLVACGKGVLEILEIQKEGRSRQKAAEFLNGAGLRAGDVFG